MSLAELVGEDVAKERKGKPFGIDPRRAYDRKEFAKRADKLFDLEEHSQALRQNVNDMNALNDVKGDVLEYMVGKKEDNAVLLSENPHLAVEQADTLLTSGYVAMAQFVENKANSLLNKLDEKALYQIFMRTPSFETGNKEYDRIKKLKDKVRQIQQASQQGGDPDAAVQKEVQELIKNAPDEQKAFIARNQHLVIPSLMKAVSDDIQQAYAGLFRDEHGKFDKNAMIEYLKAQYEVVKTGMNDAPNDREKYNLWDKNLKPHYIEVARALLKPEKKAQKMEDNPEKEKWKAKVGEKGMRT